MRGELKRLGAGAAALMILVCGVILSVNGFSGAKRLYFRCVGASPAYVPPKILVDAGHGGVDGGAVSPIDKTVEKELNLAVAARLCDLLKIMGYDVVMTRTEDISIHGAEANTIRQKKVSDLKNRLKLLDEGDCELLISVHMNIFSESRYSGTQVFYGGGNERSLPLAEELQKSVKSLVQPDNERVVKRSGKSIYILYNAKKPAVMAECGFLSNYEELTRLKSPPYQQKLAAALMSGLNEYQYGRYRQYS